MVLEISGMWPTTVCCEYKPEETSLFGYADNVAALVRAQMVDLTQIKLNWISGM